MMSHVDILWSGSDRQGPILETGRMRCAVIHCWPDRRARSRCLCWTISRSSGGVTMVAFDVVAVGIRWGGTQYNCRDNDLAPAPFGAVLSLAGASRAERVAPEHFRGY